MCFQSPWRSELHRLWQLRGLGENTNSIQRFLRKHRPPLERVILPDDYVIERWAQFCGSLGRTNQGRRGEIAWEWWEKSNERCGLHLEPKIQHWQWTTSWKNNWFPKGEIAGVTLRAADEGISRDGICYSGSFSLAFVFSDVETSHPRCHQLLFSSFRIFWLQEGAIKSWCDIRHGWLRRLGSCGTWMTWEGTHSEEHL